MAKLIDLGTIDDSSFSRKNKLEKHKPDKHKKEETRKSPLHPERVQPTSRFSKNEATEPLLKSKGKFIGKKKKTKKKKIILLILLFLFLGTVTAAVLYANGIIQNLKDAGVNVDVGKVILDNIPGNKQPEVQLTKDGDLTNVLLVGIDARNVNTDIGNTDSMIIASFNHVTNKITMISVPRDLQGTFRLGTGNKTVIKDQKINAAYALAYNYKYPGGGTALLRAALTEMTGLQIHYTVQVNFKAFKDIVDQIGGIIVNVENNFTDYTYPNDSDTGLITISFKAGVQQMNGKTALQFARSRHSADNGEGTDFARAKRQQKIIQAIEEKIKAKNIFTDLGAIQAFTKIFGQNVKIEETDNSAAVARSIDTDDLTAVLNLKDKADTKNISNLVLDPLAGGLNNVVKPYSSPELYIIYPTLGASKYDGIKAYVNFVLTNPDLYKENRFSYDTPVTYADVGVVDNGVGYSAAVKEASNIVDSYIQAEYMAVLKAPLVLTAANATATPPVAQKTLSGYAIYSVAGKYPETLDFLAKKYGATLLTADQVPDNIKKITKGYDIILFIAK